MKDRIRKIRKDAGLSQQAFCEKIGVRQQAVTNWETGQRQPSNPVIETICIAFGVNKGWLMTGEGEPYTKLNSEEALGVWIGEALASVPEDARRRLLAVLPQMSVEGIEAVAKFAEFVLNRDK